MKMNDYKSKEKGITLVVLVITIIIMLILVTVTIQLATGTGLFDYAKRAKAQYKEIQAEEIELANIYIHGNKPGEDMNDPDDKEPEEVKKAINIGKKVNYVAKNDSSLIWRLFYADDDYVYLISSKQQEQQDGTIKEIEAQRTNYGGLGGVGLINQESDSYTGTDDITDSFLKSLNSKYFEIVGEQGSTEDNAKALAWFMDQDLNLWKGYKDESGNAAYVIAGPTMELLVKSFNATSDYNGEEKITIYCSQWGYGIVNSAEEKLKNTYNHGIYHLSGGKDSFWLASPGGNEADETYRSISIRTSGGSPYGLTYGIYFGYTNYNLGLRPVVIIPTEKFIEAGYTLTDE